MTTEDTSQSQNTKTKVKVRFATSDDLDDMLKYCKERYGHSSSKSGWWWHTGGKWRDKKAVFIFEREEDATAFILSKGKL
jgi:hypothetical protein